MRTPRFAVRTVLASALVAIVAVLVPATNASAAIINVTRFDDPVEDGCATDGCSLREAIQQANGDAVADTIVLGAGTYSLTQSGASEDGALSGDLDVLQDLTIQGAGSAITIIDGQWSGAPDRILHVLGAGSDFSILGSTIQDGNTGATDSGGGIFVAAATTLTATDLIVRKNRGQYAAGIDNDGTATLTRTWFIENAGDSGTGFGCCGGFYNEPGSTATLTNVAFIANTAIDDTGALYSDGVSLTITNALFVGNTAGSTRGGALIASNGLLDITNATFSGNSIAGPGADGGALATEAGSTTNLNNVTMTGNSAATGDGGAVYRQAGTITIRNSIIAGNTDDGGQAPDCGALSGDAFTSGGHNLIGSTTGCIFTPGAGDLMGVNPLLGPLADNGGLTETHALLKGSPAIDAGGSDCAPTDQRGLARNCDIGAYELVLCATVPVNRIGTEGNDVLSGTSGADGFLAFGGNDRASGLGGNDGACLGAGKDTAGGGAGKDRLRGQAGKDTLRGGGGRDRLNGGGGKDTCIGGGGKDKATCEKEKSVP